MVQGPRSSTAKLKRDILLYTTSCVVVGAVLHFSLPWFDITLLADLVKEWPIIIVGLLGAVALLFVFAGINDRFAGR